MAYYATSTLKHAVSSDKCIKLILPGILISQGESFDAIACLLYTSNRDLGVIPKSFTTCMSSSPVKIFKCF